VIREYWIRTSNPPYIFRQDTASGYALIVQSVSGERLLTIPGLREADFTFHGNVGVTTDQLADFIVRALTDSAADHLRKMRQELLGMLMTDGIHRSSAVSDIWTVWLDGKRVSTHVGRDAAAAAYDNHRKVP